MRVAVILFKGLYVPTLGMIIKHWANRLSRLDGFW